MDRDLAWDACYNARDLGGLPTADGGRTQRGAIIRADMLYRLTAAGRRAALDYGLRTIVDLRAPWEAQAEPSAFPPGDGAPLYLNLPLEKYDPDVSAKIRAAASRVEVYCLVLDHYPDAVVEIMRAIAGAAPGAVAIHCQAGKDRTGTVAALLLRLAGVPDQEIAGDYAASEPRLMPLYERIAAQSQEEPLWLKPTAEPQTILDTLEHLDTVYGGVQAYLRAAGMTDAEVARLRARLRSG